MTPDERKVMWQKRIEAYKVSGESSVKAWCAKNHVGVQSMYKWLQKERNEPEVSHSSPQQWVSLEPPVQEATSPASLIVTIDNISIELKQGFDPALFTQVIQLLQTNAK